MADYLSLEEAAKKLGISTDRLVDLRSQGQVRGFRDGASWKFPEDAIAQLAEDLADELGEAAGSRDLMESGDLLMESEGEDLLAIDSSELKLSSPAISHDSAEINLSSEKPLDGGSGASSLELMDELNVLTGSDAGAGSSPSSGVLSELDLLGEDGKNGSGLISGDSDLLLDDDLSSDKEADDALAEDDDLVIAADDDDLLLGSAGSDISIAGDSGINLMSPSDSGLSLESEPLDLAGSSISSLDLDVELGEGSNSGSKSGDLAVDFEADEEFQLSPSGIGLDADLDSGSQVIEIEESEAIADAVDFADADAFGDADALDDAVFASSSASDDALALDSDDEAIALDDGGVVSTPVSAAAAYEVPFTLFQCVTLVLIICVMSLGGMLMTDLVRNLWTYAEPTTPISSLTDSLIEMMGW
ncbi:helix-turn-helix domain-containing protein [Rubripirellula sp.]|jgi:excisionase family DNA binding protein|nr:helix-turn-helix domain-containing protein [Rubripirellula sp.]